MKDGKTVEDLIDFLSDIGEQYTPEHPEEKTGIGHEIEHMKGVMHRSDEIAGVINDNPGKYDGIKIDTKISTTIAALHDIGNTVSRSIHNLIGMGTVQGSLSVEDILSAPFGRQSTPKDSIEKILAVDDGKADLSSLTLKEQNTYIQALSEVIAFDIGYSGISLDEIDTNSEAMSRAVNGLKENSKLIDDLQYNPDLKGITEGLHELFTDDEIKIIAEAIQDHNIDHDGADRYTARSIYGMIVADADKDNVIETFIIRTLAFSENKCPMMYDRFVDDYGFADIETCRENVAAQAWERFRPLLSGLEAKYQDVPAFIKEVYGIEGLKGVAAGNEAEEYVREHPDVVLREYNGTEYCIKQEKGDDSYSQIDAKFEPGVEKGTILSLRDDFTKDAELLARYAEDHSIVLPPYMDPALIDELLVLAPSIEAAVDLVESLRWGLTDQDWISVVKYCLNDEKGHNIDHGMDRDSPEAREKILTTVVGWYLDHYIEWNNPYLRVDQIMEDIRDLSRQTGIPLEKFPLDKLEALQDECDKTDNEEDDDDGMEIDGFDEKD